MDSFSKQIVKIAKQLIAENQSINVDQLLNNNKYGQVYKLVTEKKITDEDQLKKIVNYMKNPEHSGLMFAAKIAAFANLDTGEKEDIAIKATVRFSKGAKSNEECDQLFDILQVLQLFNKTFLKRVLNMVSK